MNEIVTVRVSLDVLRKYVKDHPELEGLLEKGKRQALVDIMLREASKK